VLTSFAAEDWTRHSTLCECQVEPLGEGREREMQVNTSPAYKDGRQERSLPRSFEEIEEVQAMAWTNPGNPQPAHLRDQNGPGLAVGKAIAQKKNKQTKPVKTKEK
jgi:hypothetical protein